MPGRWINISRAFLAGLDAPEKALFAAFTVFIVVNYLVTAGAITHIAFYAFVLPALLWHGVRHKTQCLALVRLTPLLWMLFAYILLHALFLTDPAQDIAKIIRNTLSTALFLLASGLFFSLPLPALQRFLHFLVLVAGLGAFLSLIFFAFDPPVHGRLEPVGRGNHSVLGASVYGIAGLVACWLAAQGPSPLDKRLYWFIITLVGIVIIFTQSRMPFLLYSGGLLFTILIFHRPPLAVKRLLVTLFMLGLAAIATLFLTGALYWRGGYRFMLWAETIEQIKLAPWFGHGLFAELKVLAWHIRTPHNLYLSTAFYLGLPALALLLTVIIKTVRRAWPVRRDPYGALCLTLVAYGLASCLTDHAQLVKSPSSLWLIFWLPLTMAWGQELRFCFCHPALVAGSRAT